VWPVTEIVTYGFDPSQAPLSKVGKHLTPKEFHAALTKKDSVVSHCQTIKLM
jgi:predicted sulfurtransferase